MHSLHGYVMAHKHYYLQKESDDDHAWLLMKGYCTLYELVNVRILLFEEFIDNKLLPCLPKDSSLHSDDLWTFSFKYQLVLD